MKFIRLWTVSNHRIDLLSVIYAKTFKGRPQVLEREPNRSMSSLTIDWSQIRENLSDRQISLSNYTDLIRRSRLPLLKLNNIDFSDYNFSLFPEIMKMKLKKEKEL